MELLKDVELFMLKSAYDHTWFKMAYSLAATGGFQEIFQPERDMDKLCLFVYVGTSSLAPGVYTLGSHLGSLTV